LESERKRKALQGEKKERIRPSNFLLAFLLKTQNPFIENKTGLDHKKSWSHSQNL
jgi:hypothetical protein